MQITVKARHLDVNDRIRGQVEKRLSGAVDKYFTSAIESQVVFEKVAHLTRTDLTIHVGHGISFQSHAEAGDILASFMAAADRLEKRMRRHKRKLRDHHKEARQAHAIQQQG